MKICFIPIDNRPVCYTLAKDICAIDEDIELFIPPRELLGSLTKYADTEALFVWLKDLPQTDVMILSLDTLAYGGLIPSRRITDSYEDIKKRIERLKPLLNNKKVYAFSSIMRISNNNYNEEEKEYWSEYGKKIFEYSYNCSKLDKKPDTDIPNDILNDYIETRKRNFEINKLYLEWQKEGFFEKLIFSKDDCAEYGLNVMEAKELNCLSSNFSNSVLVKTGADEIPLSLLSKAVSDYSKLKIKVAPIFLEDDCKNLISNYEDISIEQCVKSQLELAGCEISDCQDTDVILYVNNFKSRQGELVMKIDTEHFKDDWEKPEKPYIIADVRFANGADNVFVEKLLEVGLDKNFLGYAGWNTSANTLGSLICAMVNSFHNKNAAEFKKLQVTRFLDDWAYQANVRGQREKPDTKKCKELMKPFEDRIFKAFNVKYDVQYSFPWNRLFEIEVKISLL